MTRCSGGLLLYRHRDDVSGGVEVLLAHPGGPLYASKDAGVWTVPKGEPDPADEDDLLTTAVREFTEELGIAPPAGARIPLGEVRQRGGKVVTAWAVAGDLDPAAIVPGTFTMPWPPRSGRTAEFPEVDRVAWFDLAEAAVRIRDAQATFLDRLADHLAAGG